MGLFDEVAGKMGHMLDGQQPQEGVADNPLVQALMGLLSSSGGLSALLEKFQQGGLGEVVQSWVGTGANLPVSAEQIQQVLGSGVLTEMAGKFGVQPEQAADQLAQALPEVVDKLTPNGRLPAEGERMHGAHQLLGRFLS